MIVSMAKLEAQTRTNSRLCYKKWEPDEEG